MENIETIWTKIPHLGTLSRKRWWGLGGLAVLVVGGGLVYLRAIHAATTVGTGFTYRVGYGTVVQTISASGQIQPLQAISMNFSTSGTVSAVDVKVGEMVHAGQVLATLSDPSGQAQLAAAQAAVAEAQANLQKATEPPTPQAIAEDQAAVQHAQIVLAGAEQQLKDEQALYNDRTSAQAAVISARNQVAADKAALAAAQANVAAAQVKLQQVQADVSTSAVPSLQTTLTAEQKALAADQAQLAADQATLKNAQQDLATAQANQSQDEQLYGALAAQYPADEAAYQQVLQEYQNGSGYPTNPWAAKLSEASSVAQQAQSAYNLLQSDQSQVQSDQAAVLQAQKAVTNDQSEIETAQANLQSTEQQLANLQASNPLSVQAAQVALTQAQDAEQQAAVEYRGAQASLAAAQAVYNDRLSAQQAVDQAQNTVAVDQNAVVSAQDALNALEAPPDPATVAAAQAAVQQAQAQLQAEEATLANDVLKAPINGEVVAVNITPGDAVTASTTVIQIDSVGKGSLETEVMVPEAEIGSVKAGEAVSVTVPAYPNQVFPGQVLQVYPSPQVVSNVTEYPVITSVTGSGKLMPGMTANVSIVTQKASHVLTVPAVALVSRGSVEGVYVQAPGAPPPAKGLPAGIRFQPVTVGLLGSSTVEIKSGLQPGETIVMTAGAAAAGGPAGGFRPGGGFGGPAGVRAIGGAFGGRR